MTFTVSTNICLREPTVGWYKEERAGRRNYTRQQRSVFSQYFDGYRDSVTIVGGFSL